MALTGSRLLLAAALALGASSAYGGEFHFRTSFTFPLGEHYTGQGSRPDAVATGDVTGDGLADVVMTTRATASVNLALDYSAFIFEQGAHGALKDPVRYPFDPNHFLSYGGTDGGLVLAHLNGDDILDIVVGFGRGISILASKPDGTFGLKQYRSIPSDVQVRNVVALDVDLDGHMDVVAHNFYTGATIFHGDGAGGISKAEAMATPATRIQDVEVADLTGDGFPDLVVTSDSRPEGQPLWIVPHDGVGGFAPPTTYLHPEIDDYGPPQGIAVGDFNMDGLVDLAYGERKNYPVPRVLLRLNTGAGLSQPYSLPAHFMTSYLVGRDLDMDGRQDIVMSDGTYIGHYISGPQGFAEPWAYGGPYSSSYNHQGLASGDINGDGCGDTVAANYNYGLVVMRGHGCDGQATRPVAHDFDGDGQSDVFWRNAGTGANVLWMSADGADRRTLPGVNLNWEIQGIGDVDGDERADVFWRNIRTGHNVFWKSANAATKLAARSVTNLAWQVQATGDFNDDGRSDLFWRNLRTGANVIWFSGNFNTQQSLYAVTNQQWQVLSAGDFDGDGRSDLFWRHAGTGANTIWRSGNFDTKLSVATAPPQEWRFQAVADFDGDGRDDLLWRRLSTGENILWKQAKHAREWNYFAFYMDPEWQLPWTGDADGDGRADMFWRNTKTGENRLWPAARPEENIYLLHVADLRWQLMPRP